MWKVSSFSFRQIFNQSVYQLILNISHSFLIQFSSKGNPKLHFVNVTDGAAVENLSAHPTRKIIVRIQYGALLKSKWRIRNIKDIPSKWILSLSRAMQEASCHWDLSRRSLWNWQMLEKTSRIFEDI